jgi:hypothetical protein
MQPDTIPWIIATASAALLAAAITLWVLRQRRSEPLPLPTDWSLTGRPVFTSDERRVYRQLREALPHHIVLSKLPLVRFCQPSDPQQVRYWYDLLGAIHVGFAICSANGRVLAAIDIDNDRGNAQRSLQIKQKVLAACRVRYLRCPVDHLPSVPELQLLVPLASQSVRSPQAAPVAAPADTPDKRRDARALWHDSSFFQDSFFSPDSRHDVSSGFGGFMRGLGVHQPPAGDPATEPGQPPAVRH